MDKVFLVAWLSHHDERQRAKGMTGFIYSDALASLSLMEEKVFGGSNRICVRVPHWKGDKSACKFWLASLSKSGYTHLLFYIAHIWSVHHFNIFG